MGAVPHLIWHHALDQRLALHRQVVLFDCDAFTQKFYKAKWLDCQNGQSSGGFDLWNPEGNLLSPCCFYNTSEKYLSFSVVDVLTSCYNSWFFLCAKNWLINPIRIRQTMVLVSLDVRGVLDIVGNYQ